MFCAGYEVKEVIFCFKVIRIWKIKDVALAAYFIEHAHVEVGTQLD